MLSTGIPDARSAGTGRMKERARQESSSSKLRTGLVLAALGGTLGTGIVFAPQAAQAYPVLVPAKEIPWMVGAKRANLIAIAFSQGQWKRIPLQLEEIEEDIAIVFREPTESWPVRKKLHKPKTQDPFDGYFDVYHRAVIDDQDAGLCDSDCASGVRSAAQRLCTGESYRRYARTTRIDLDYTKATAFIVDCMSNQPEVFRTTSSIDAQNFIFKGDHFEFQYKNDKSVMIDQFRFGSDQDPVLTNTEMHVFLKPKFMFNMHFENKDVTAEISSLTYGPLSLAVEIATALNVFVFQINKQICCDINVFKDALYFPVMLDLPYSGDAFAKGSGLFYGFGITNDTHFEYFPATESDEKHSAQGRAAIALGQEGKLVTIGFGNLKSIKGKDLSPIEENRENLNRIGFPKVTNNHGIFYDATQLPDGFNHFNVWFFIGSEAERPKLLNYARHGISYTVQRIW